MDRIIRNRMSKDPWWSRTLSRNERYPSTPSRINLSRIRATPDELWFKIRDLPSRYHWYIWLEHAGTQIYYVYDDVPDSILYDEDTTVDQLTGYINYLPHDQVPIMIGQPDTFDEFLEAIYIDHRHYIPFISKYNVKRGNTDQLPPVSAKMAVRAMSMVLDTSNMEQDLWHLFCIIQDACKLYWG